MLTQLRTAANLSISLLSTSTTACGHFTGFWLADINNSLPTRRHLWAPSRVTEVTQSAFPGLTWLTLLCAGHPLCSYYHLRPWAFVWPQPRRTWTEPVSMAIVRNNCAEQLPYLLMWSNTRSKQKSAWTNAWSKYPLHLCIYRLRGDRSDFWLSLITANHGLLSATKSAHHKIPLWSQWRAPKIYRMPMSSVGHQGNISRQSTVMAVSFSLLITFRVGGGHSRAP